MTPIWLGESKSLAASMTTTAIVMSSAAMAEGERES